MRKTNRRIWILTLGIILIIPLFAYAVTSYGQEIYDSTARDIWVKVPLDMWYVDAGGITEFPVYIKAQGYQEQGTFGWHYEPRELLIDVYVRDLTLGWAADWMELADYAMHSSTYGTKLTIEGKAGVRGEYGDNENYKIRGDIGFSISGSSTEIQTHSWDLDDTNSGGYCHLGQIQIVMATGGVTQNDFVVSVKIGIPNEDAGSYDTHRFAVKIKTEMWFKAYWYGIPYAC